MCRYYTGNFPFTFQSCQQCLKIQEASSYFPEIKVRKSIISQHSIILNPVSGSVNVELFYKYFQIFCCPTWKKKVMFHQLDKYSTLLITFWRTYVVFNICGPQNSGLVVGRGKWWNIHVRKNQLEISFSQSSQQSRTILILFHLWHCSKLSTWILSRFVLPYLVSFSSQDYKCSFFLLLPSPSYSFNNSKFYGNRKGNIDDVFAK